MDGNLVMKSSSFNVKDILDLQPDGKLACSPVSHETSTTTSFRTIPNIPDLPSVDYGSYDVGDNPYARWLQNNSADVMQYTRKYNNYLSHDAQHTHTHICRSVCDNVELKLPLC